MLTQGNRKLGRKHIWGFTLPSGTDAVCPGRTISCSHHCYARRLEKIRPNAHKAYRRNLHLSQRKDFPRRVYHFVRAMRIRTVRIHVGGDFYSDEYARKWLRIIERSPKTRFYFYSRSWRVPPIRTVLEQMACLPNCRAWYSCDQETGLPAQVPATVKLAWLQVDEEEEIASNIDLVFRRQGLRRLSLSTIAAKVCPEQDGVARSMPVTCEQCQLCLRPELTTSSTHDLLSSLHLAMH
ncbi:MAG TPA: hypothetical protein PLX97_07965 [Gemmatales bacterium]|nr:hypothetical protein [Gemmatales bacterium]